MSLKLVLAMTLAMAAFAQDAKIILVERQDSRELARAYKTYQDAKAEWDRVKTEIAAKYTKDEKGKIRLGWETIQFNADFRVMVPESSVYAYHANWGCWPSSVVLTNATGTATAADITASSGTAMTVTADPDRAVSLKSN